MTTTLSDIRFLIEREIKATLENKEVIVWCNQVNADIGELINLPDTAEIEVNTTDLAYAEPAGLKAIVRMWLQSDYDAGIDKEYRGNYRRYNGEIIFRTPFWQDDTLHVDFYRHFETFDDISDEIELDDRYAPLYAFYGRMMYYLRAGSKEADAANVAYLSMRQQLMMLHTNDDGAFIVEESW